MTTVKLAVYGTLRKGQGLSRTLETSDFLGEERISGFEMRNLGSFPAVYPKENSEITVEFYNVNKETLDYLDGVEGHPNFYERILVKDFYIYYIPEERIVNRRIIQCGDWVKFLQEKN